MLKRNLQNICIKSVFNFDNKKKSKNNKFKKNMEKRKG